MFFEPGQDFVFRKVIAVVAIIKIKIIKKIFF